VNRYQWFIAAGLACLALIVATPGFSHIIHVPGDYEQIHVAVEFARRGDTVLVAPGRYEESVRLRSVDFVLGSLLLTTGDPDYIEQTIIDGSRTGTPVLRADGGNAGSPLCRGFTVTGGMTDYGGGIICRDSTRPVFEDLRIFDNEAEFMGGGAYCYYGSSPTFRRVEFIGNRSRSGGGIGEYQATPRYEYCTISNNTAQGGGGIYSYLSSSTLVNCKVERNSSGNLTFNYSHAELLRVTIANGDLESESVFIRGGLMGQPTVFDRVTLFSSRAATTGIRVVGANGEFALAQFKLVNSIVSGNSDRLINLGDGAIEVRAFIDYTLVQGGENSVRLNGRTSLEWGDSNRDQDPLFLDAEDGDFQLDEESPCIDVGDPNSDPDPDNSRADLGGIPFAGFPASAMGNVTDLRSGEPVAGAEVILFDDDRQLMQAETNAFGNWNGVALQHSFSGKQYQMLARRPFSRNSHGRIILLTGGISTATSTIEVEPFVLSQERFELLLDPGERDSTAFTLRSLSAGVTFWSMALEADDWPVAWYMTASPDAGALLPDSTESLWLRLDTSNDSTEALAPGQYAAILRFSAEDCYYDIILPVEITVTGSEVPSGNSNTPAQIEVFCYPNPFNSTTRLSFGVPNATDVTIAVFGIDGRLVETIINDRLEAGRYSVAWNGHNYSTGLYVLRMDAGYYTSARRLVLVK